MPAIASIYVNSLLVGDQAVMVPTVLTNSATVATDGTLTPAGSPAPGVTRWEDMRGDIPSCYPWMTFQMRRPVKQSPFYRIQSRFGYLVPEAEIGVASNGLMPGPRPAYHHLAALDIQLAERGTAEDRAIFYSYFLGSLAKSLKASDLSPAQDTGSPIPSAVLTLQGVWGS